MRNFADPEYHHPVKLPFAVQVHMVAALYGQTPESVRQWPADDFRDALNFRLVTDVR